MPVGIGYDNGQTRIPEQGRQVQQSPAEDVRRRERTETLENRANEQRARDRAAQNNGLLAESQQTVIRPDPQTLATLESHASSSNPNNANGLGQTAIRSYQSLEQREIADNLGKNIKVDITA